MPKRKIKKSRGKRKLKAGIDFLYPAKKAFQLASNAYRATYKKLHPKANVRPLDVGEFHYGVHSYTGPGTRIDKYGDFPPFNDIDNCSRTHDFDYAASDKESDPKKRAAMIRQADEEAIKCYNKYPNENGYTAAKLGINGKMKFENVFPIIAKSIIPYSGKGCEDYPYCGGDFYDDTFEEYDGGAVDFAIDLFGFKPRESLTQPINDAIEIVAIDPSKATPFGSFVYRAQPFPGDIDLSEKLDLETDNIDEAINIFEKLFKKVIKKISKTRGIYLGDVKVGLDNDFNRLEDLLGEWNNGELFDYNPRAIKSELYKLYSKGYIHEDDYKKMTKLIGFENINNDQWDELYESIRKYHVLRWKDKELLKGKKSLLGKRIKTLNDALHDKTMVKIDIWVNINGRYIEMSNFFILQYHEKDDYLGSFHLINLPDDFFKKVPNQLKKEIEKLFYSKTFFKPFKMAKRMWSIARANATNNKISASERLKNVDYLEQLTPLIRSDASLASQINAEIETIMLILENIKSPPMPTLKRQINGFKGRLANIYELAINNEDGMYKLIDKIVKSDSKKNMISHLKILKKYLLDKINNYTLDYLDEVGLIPIPEYFLPENKKYLESEIGENMDQKGIIQI